MTRQDKTVGEWFTILLDRHQGALLRYASAICGDADRAADCVQESFRKLLLEDPRPTGSRVVPWLFRVCRNQALDVRRKEMRMTRMSDVTCDDHVAPGGSPSAHAELAEAGLEVKRMLAAMKPEQREVVRLKFSGGLSYREIAEVTGLTQSHVGVLLHDAMKSVRGRMGQLAANAEKIS